MEKKRKKNGRGMLLPKKLTEEIVVEKESHAKHESYGCGITVCS